MKANLLLSLILLIGISCSKTNKNSQTEESPDPVVVNKNYHISDSVIYRNMVSSNSSNGGLDSASTEDYPLSYTLQIGQCAADTPYIILRGQTYYKTADIHTYGRSMDGVGGVDYAQIVLNGDSLSIISYAHFIHFQQSKTIVSGLVQ